MLSLARLDLNHVHRALQAAGGFAWWYLDLVGPRGDGAVLLWSFGLPFLPGARARPIALERPALSLATYEAGRPTFYLLQEHEGATWQDGHWRFGRSVIDLAQTASGVRLHASLDLDLPAGDRLCGTLVLEGSHIEAPAPCVSPHRWTPIAAHARATLELGTQTIAGRAYCDANASTEPLESLGIADWRWGRLAFPDHELIYFFCLPERADASPVRLVLRVERDGATQIYDDVRAEWLDERRAVYGLKHHRALRLTGSSGLDVEIVQRHLVDDGPFYLRFLTEGRDRRTGAAGLGSAERVVPGRVDVGWQRPFVRMRRHRIGGDNSMWLPLFAGPRRGRLGRLVRHWWQEGA